jgi:hypothetical protein
MRIPVTEESIQRSPIEMVENGMMNSTIAKMQTATLCVPNERNAPRCQAIGNSIAAASTMRPQATTKGESSWTANLMKKYGNPQITPSAANANHPRQLTKVDPSEAKSGEWI